MEVRIYKYIDMVQEPSQLHALTLEETLAQTVLAPEQRHQAFRQLLPQLNPSLQLLPKIQCSSLFRSLFAFLLDKGITPSLLTFTVQHLSQSQPQSLSPHRAMLTQGIVRELMAANCPKEVIDQVRNSQNMALNMLFYGSSILAQNPSVASGSREGRAENKDGVTQLSVMALKIIQFPLGVDDRLLEEAVRFVLVADRTKQGRSTVGCSSEGGDNQLLSIIAQNQTTIASLRSIPLSGYLLLLVDKLSALFPSASVQQLHRATLEALLDRRNPQADLSGQIKKIRDSTLSQKEQLRVLRLVRGECIFVGEHVRRSILEGILDEECLGLFRQLLGLRDFGCFDFLLPACLLLAASKETVPEYIASSVLHNCLPASLSTSTSVPRIPRIPNTGHDDGETVFLREGGRLYSAEEYPTSSKSSVLVDQLLARIMGENAQSPAIYDCFEEQLYADIEKQYQQQFQAQQLASACSLMCREVRRVAALDPPAEAKTVLKEYVVAKAKWLLNLAETSLPEHRPAIHTQIFRLLLSHPPILAGNDFLHQVLQDLLIARTPSSLPSLGLLMEHSLQSQPSKAERLREKVLRRAGEEGTLGEKVELWSLAVAGVSEQRAEELVEVYSLREQQWLAKELAFRSRGMAVPGAVERGASEVRERIEREPFCYWEEKETVELWEWELKQSL